LNSVETYAEQRFGKGRSLPLLPHLLLDPQAVSWKNMHRSVRLFETPESQTIS